ncbi:DUF302 domain-containing protein [bacterium]|nr:DUF302 domain-containing protein [bacterium]
MSYHISKFVDLNFDQAVERVTENLKIAGFGVITEIDVKATFKKKLDQDFRRYLILGACNPKFAHRALSLEDKLGVLIPCNVVVQEHTDGRVEVSAMDPGLMLQIIEQPELRELAQDVRGCLQKVVDSL